MDKLSLDFDDITGTKVISEKKVQEQPESTKLTGVVLCIPVEKNKWNNRDLAECTGEEFVHWAINYYPVDFSAYTKDLDNLTRRFAVLQSIIQYHTSALHFLSKSGEPNTTMH